MWFHCYQLVANRRRMQYNRTNSVTYFHHSYEMWLHNFTVQCL